MHPNETIAENGTCPDCGKPVTIGVMARVEALADRNEGEKPSRWRHFYSVIPLHEIIGEAKKVGPRTKTVDTIYQAMIAQLGNELDILLDIPEEDIEMVSGSLIAEGIRRMRVGEVDILPGYDGDYGIVKLFNQADRVGDDTQIALHDELPGNFRGPSLQKFQDINESSLIANEENHQSTNCPPEVTPRLPIASGTLHSKDAIDIAPSTPNNEKTHTGSVHSIPAPADKTIYAEGPLNEDQLSWHVSWHLSYTIAPMVP